MTRYKVDWNGVKEDLKKSINAGFTGIFVGVPMVLVVLGPIALTLYVIAHYFDSAAVLFAGGLTACILWGRVLLALLNNIERVE